MSRDRRRIGPSETAAAAPASAGASPLDTLRLETPVAALNGIGPKRAAALADRGIVTVFDLILNLPARYQDWRARTPWSELSPGLTVIVEGVLDDLRSRPMRGSRWRKIVTGWLRDETAPPLRLVWFNLASHTNLPGGERVAVHGKICEASDGTLEIAHPEILRLSEGIARPVRPLYRIPREIPQRLYADVAGRAASELSSKLSGAVPAKLIESAGIQPFGDALRDLHLPSAEADVAQLQAARSKSHRSLAFDEMFAFQLALLIERARKERRSGAAFSAEPALSAEFIDGLPFQITRAQHTAIDEIGRGISRDRQMNRMLMGDVGSGKTLVAFWAALRAIESGYQVLMMAPTELLAEQHHRSFDRLCGRLGVFSALLTGKMPPGQRAPLLRALARGDIPITFGTHALIQEGVKTARLGLAIIDEQHRFGVFQRARLKDLGPTAHLLLMTATPIPRSFAMMLFANLDLTILDEMPPGRTPIVTELFTAARFDEVLALTAHELEKKHRAYFVVPLIEDDDEEAAGLPSVDAMAKRLRESPLGRFRIGLLHGRMSAADKQNVMREFRDGAIDVLVSTTVVEVGIDVPEATIIVIVAAERYGLAQLHQLRGRVGRGSEPSRCCLVTSGGAEGEATRRLEILAASRNGEEVARADLEIRGPGDLLGSRQSGTLPLRFASLLTDYSIIERSRHLAEQWLAYDSKLSLEESNGCRTALAGMLREGFSLGDVG
ncbi:MAG: ATP-dependent DNA helicase RecG [Candidatus Binataceae bacterium]|nr:ATP-dependent DNA helicase RecG [Candidatus Binataceae bacterium]